MNTVTHCTCTSITAVTTLDVHVHKFRHDLNVHARIELLKNFN